MRLDSVADFYDRNGMTEPDVMQGPELIKLGAEKEAAFLENAREQGIAQAVSLSKWLTASLLAVNGAGALGSLNALDKTSHPVISSSVFIIGLTAALGSGYFNQRACFTALPTVNAQIGYWISVSLTGERLEEAEAKINDLNKPIIRRGRLGPAAGFASAICFLVGAVVLASGAGAADEANKGRCIAVQQDLISVAPRRSDDAVLFQTLGCRPQGSAPVLFPPARAEHLKSSPERPACC